MSNSNKFQSGISEIEAILAIAILSIGILAAVTLFPLALKISKNAEQETVAANLAQAKIEEIFSLGYENIPAGSIEARHRLSSEQENPFYHYEREASVALVDGNLENSASDLGLKKITVTVYWQSPYLSASKSLPVSILISQK